MNQQQKDSIVRKLQTLTEGPTPLLHVVSVQGDMIGVHIQPWGSPVYLSWSQAETFTKGLPVQMPATRKGPVSEHKRHVPKMLRGR